jgi:hypothetical protein
MMTMTYGLHTMLQCASDREAVQLCVSLLRSSEVVTVMMQCECMQRARLLCQVPETGIMMIETTETVAVLTSALLQAPPTRPLKPASRT